MCTVQHAECDLMNRFTDNYQSKQSNSQSEPSGMAEFDPCVFPHLSANQSHLHAVQTKQRLVES